MNFQLVSAIMRGLWLLPPDVAESYYPAISLLLDGHPAEFDFEEFSVQIIQPNGTAVRAEYNDAMHNAQPGAILSIPVKGVLMKNDQMCGPVGMKTLGNIIQDADANPNIKGMVLEVDSPGGSADGTQRLADIIKNTKKPTVAHVDGMAASAAYWIASAADRIVAEPRATVGSIGTMLSFADIQPALEKEGVKFHRLVSNLSPDKIKMFEQVRSGNYDEYKKEVLDPLATDFITAVKSNRTQMTDDQVTGKTYFAQDTLGSMVDQIGTLDDAIRSLDVTSTTLSDQKEPNNINPNTQTMANYEHLNQVLGVESLETTDDGVFLNQQQIEAVNAALAPAQQEPAPAAPAAQNEPPTPDPATPQAAEPTPDPTAELRQQIEALTTALEEMRNAPGSKPAIVAPKADPAKTQGPNLVTKENGDFWENVKAVKANYL
jgi:protease IV